MTTTAPKRLGGPAAIVGTASGSQTALVTVPAAHTYVVKQIILTNTSAAVRTVTMAIGTTATLANQFVSGMQLAANEVVVIDTALVLAAGEVVNAFADSASLVNATFTGWDQS